MRGPLVISLRVFTVLGLLTGVIYPLVIWVLAQSFFRDQAEGSLIERDGQVIGSRLLQQEFLDPKYFWGRPIFNSGHAVSSHWGPTSSSLSRVVLERSKVYRQWEGTIEVGDIPDSLLLASASGVDPHLDLDSVKFQVERISKVRKLDEPGENRLQELILDHLQGPQWGILGMARISILELNLSLDREFPAR